MKNHPIAYMQIYEHMRNQIIRGSYPFGSKIPSKRQCATEMNVAIVTVEHAYALLEEEGYIQPRQRSGYYVCYVEGDVFHSEDMQRDVISYAVDEEALPYTTFAKVARKVLSQYQDDILAQHDDQGDIRLRTSIASYLNRARNMSVEPEQIVIGAGAEYLYSLVPSIIGRNVIYGLENPGYQKVAHVYQAEGIAIDRLEIGKYGIQSNALQHTEARVIHVTPYRSYPTGNSTNAAKRREYIHWAIQRDGYIIEDDYASEFIPSIKTAETLYSLDPKHVIYMNTFTKTIGSSVRIGYMVLPPSLLAQYKENQSFRSCTVSEYMQLIIYELIQSGTFERHLNKVKRKQRKTYEQ